MRPKVSDVHVNSSMTNVSIGYRQSASNFVAGQVYPRVPVQRKSDTYFTFTAADFMRNQARIVAPGSPAPEADFAMSTATYTAKTVKIKKIIPWEVRDNQDPGAGLEIATAEWLANMAMIYKERDFASNHFTTSKWGTDKTFTAGTTWDVAAGSDPIGDVATGHEAVLKAIGMQANTMVVGVEVHNALSNHPVIQERVKYMPNALAQRPGDYPAVYSALAALFEVERYLVTRAVYDSAVEAETAVPTFACGKNGWLGYVAPNPALIMPSAGYTFGWTEFGNGGWQIVQYESPERSADVYQLEFCEDMKLTASAAGYFFSGAHA